MKPLSAVGLLFVLVLAVMFMYVIEDIPPYGSPYTPATKYVKLDFSLDAAGSEADLNRGVIPVELLEKLEERKFIVPSTVEKLNEGEWDAKIEKGELHYLEEEKYYFIKKEGDRLDVYRYAVIVRYLEKGLEETAVPNIVTAIIVDYRAYDTLGETSVIFTAGISVILLLRRRGKL